MPKADVDYFLKSLTLEVSLDCALVVTSFNKGVLLGNFKFKETEQPHCRVDGDRLANLLSCLKQLFPDAEAFCINLTDNPYVFARQFEKVKVGRIIQSDGLIELIFDLTKIDDNGKRIPEAAETHS